MWLLLIYIQLPVSPTNFASISLAMHAWINDGNGFSKAGLALQIPKMVKLAKWHAKYTREQIDNAIQFRSSHYVHPHRLYELLALASSL